MKCLYERENHVIKRVISAGINFCDLDTKLTEFISADFISAVEGQTKILSADPIPFLLKGALIASCPEKCDIYIQI